MPDYIDFPVDTNPDDIAADSYDYLQDQIPGWEPNEANLETIVIDASSRKSSEVRDLASRVPRAIFRYFGKLIGVDPVQDAKASIPTTWTMVDNAGYTIPAGTLAGIRTAGDELMAFEVLIDIVVPPGQVATAAGAVTLLATETGSDYNELGAIGGPVELIDPLDYVDSIVQTDFSSGGIDAETDDDYLNRLAERQSIIAPRPILAQDFATMIRINPDLNVYRALGIDGYNPADATYNNERMVAVAGMHEDGTQLTAAEKTAADDYLEAQREVNFIVNVIDPTYTLIDVSYHVLALPGYTADDIQTRVDAAIDGYLDASSWGIPDTATNFGSSTDWVNQDTVYFWEVVQAISNVIGVDRIVDLNIGVHGGALAKNDIVLPGAAPLPNPGDITPTVDLP